MFLSIKARSVTNNGNGTYDIELPFDERPLSDEERKLLEALFPNLLEQAYMLMHKEQLLESLASPSERAAKPQPGNEYLVGQAVKPSPKRKEF